MNESNTYQAIRIGDISDWRMICAISQTGMGAWLKNDDPMREVETMFRQEWKVADEQLLRNIENCVYDHPQVLDDFSADITIEAPKSVWIPTEIVEDNEDEAFRLYNQIYQADDNDIMSEQVGEATCLFSLAPGLNAFLQRTFPGARVHSHLAVLAQRFRERSADMPRIYCDIRQSEVDMLAFDRKNLLMAATHCWHDPNDILYHLFNILNVYGLNPAEVQVSLSGLKEIKTSLMQELRKTLSYVMLTMVPSIGSKADMPLAACLLLRK